MFIRLFFPSFQSTRYFECKADTDKQADRQSLSKPVIDDVCVCEFLAGYGWI